MSLSRKLAVSILSGKSTVEDLDRVLAKYKMTSLFPSIKKELVQLTSQSASEDTIMIESPFSLSEESITKIKGFVGDATVKHEVTINKNILAGFTARFRGKLYDGSAERIIKQLTGKQ
jgi:F0F1-type ATP synthase delta subunit